jgi:hypothetical protein
MNLNKAGNRTLSRISAGTGCILEQLGKKTYWDGSKQSHLTYEEKRECLIRAMRCLKEAEKGDAEK